jgi:hypothetical protein
LNRISTLVFTVGEKRRQKMWDKGKRTETRKRFWNRKKTDQNPDQKRRAFKEPLLTFCPPGPPLLAKLTVTCSANKDQKSLSHYLHNNAFFRSVKKKLYRANHVLRLMQDVLCTFNMNHGPCIVSHVPCWFSIIIFYTCIKTHLSCLMYPVYLTLPYVPFSTCIMWIQHHHISYSMNNANQTKNTIYQSQMLFHLWPSPLQQNTHFQNATT